LQHDAVKGDVAVDDEEPELCQKYYERLRLRYWWNYPVAHLRADCLMAVQY